MALILLWPLHEELRRSGSLHVPAAAVRRFRDLAARAWAPVAGLALLLILQEIHVIVVKHEASDDAAGAYAAAAVAGKAIIWVAVGLGLYLLPEAARRTKSGIDARPVLVQTLALIGVLALPMVAGLHRGRAAAARDRVRRGLRPGRERSAVARHVDGAARLRLPRGAVPARTRQGAVHRGARHRRRRRAAAPAAGRRAPAQRRARPVRPSARARRGGDHDLVPQRCAPGRRAGPWRLAVSTRPPSTASRAG